MKRQFLFGTIFAAAMAVGLGAQSQGTTGQGAMAGSSSSQATAATSNHHDSDMKSQKSSEKVTVTGCVEGADAAMGTTGTSGSMATNDTKHTKDMGPWRLTNVERGGSTASTSGTASMNGGVATSGGGYGSTAGSSSATGTSSMAGTSGTTGTSGSMNANSGTSFTLTGKNLAKYAGQRVEIRGTLENGGNWSNGASANDTSAAGTSANASDMGGTLKVSSVRPASGTCAANGGR